MSEEDGSVQVQADSTELLVVDMQNDFCDPDGALYAEGSEEVIPAVQETVRNIGQRVDEVAFTADTHEDGDPEFEKWGPHCLDGSWGNELHPEIRQVHSECHRSIRVGKDTYDAFHDTYLANWLKSSGIDTVVICGTLANVCVQETASSANLHGFDVIVVEDAVGYITEEQRERALEHIDFLIGDVVKRSEITVV